MAVQAKQAYLGRLASLVAQVPMAHWGIRVMMDREAKQETQVLLVELAGLVTEDCQDLQAPVVVLVRRVNLGFLGDQETRGRMGILALGVKRATMESLAPRVLLVWWDPKAREAHLVYLGLLVSLVVQEDLDDKALKAPKVMQVIQEMKAPLVPKVIQALRVRVEIKEHEVFLGYREHLERKGQLDQKEVWVLLVQQVQRA